MIWWHDIADAPDAGAELEAIATALQFDAAWALINLERSEHTIEMQLIGSIVSRPEALVCDNLRGR